MVKQDWNDTELEIALSMFVENLLRITAGAGRVQDIRRQLDRLITATKAHENEKTGKGWNHIDNLIENKLNIGIDWPTHDEQASCIYQIVRSSLRLAAARLVSDNSQSSKSKNELLHSIRLYNNAK